MSALKISDYRLRGYPLTRKIRRAGKLPKQCERCGSERHLHCHHDDYSKPDQITVLCARCHRARHRELGWGIGGAGNVSVGEEKINGMDAARPEIIAEIKQKQRASKLMKQTLIQRRRDLMRGIKSSPKGSGLDLPKIKCCHCNGTGEVEDRTLIGPALKAERVAVKVSGLSIAILTGTDKSTLHNMELGKVPQRWTPAFIAAYRKAYRTIAGSKKRRKERALF